MVIKRGDIFYADLRPVVGSEQGGIRPVPVSYTHLDVYKRQSLARDTLPLSPPEREEISLNTSSPVKRNAASIFRISVSVRVG